MTLVKHPAIDGAVKDVPAEDVAAWLEQGWLLVTPEVRILPAPAPAPSPVKRRKRR